MILASQILALLVLVLKFWLDRQTKKPVDKRSAFVIGLVKERSLKRGKAINEKDTDTVSADLSNTVDELNALLQPKDNNPTK